MNALILPTEHFKENKLVSFLNLLLFSDRVCQTRRPADSVHKHPPEAILVRKPGPGDDCSDGYGHVVYELESQVRYFIMYADFNMHGLIRLYLVT